jgi:thioester reductase-like protein
VLLTGATGFLGARLRRALLARGHHVVALVRAPNDLAARARLGDELGGVVAGDVTRERFGLDVASWRALAATTDTVVHLAADVSLAASFESLAPSNVDGTKHALQLAAEAGARVVHASTLSVFVASDREDSVFFEADDASAPCRLAGGYAQSKWVAERAVRSAGLGGAIVRYGLLTGASDDGASPSGDWLVRFVRALAQLRGFPAGLDTSELAFDATPIDHAVDATCRIVEHASFAGMETFHVASARAVHVGRLIAAIRDEGVSLAPVAHTMLAQIPEASIVLGVARALDPRRFARQRALDLFAATGVRFDDARARALGIVAPSVDDAYLRRCVRWMLSSVHHEAA